MAYQKIVGALCLVTLGMVSHTAFAKIATCEVSTNGVVEYRGKCQFDAERGGSFNISHPSKRTIIPGVTDISVSIIQKNVAEVRGLTTNGINSH